MTQPNFGVVVVVVEGAYAVFTSLILRIGLINNEDDDDGVGYSDSNIVLYRIVVVVGRRSCLVRSSTSRLLVRETCRHPSNLVSRLTRD